MVQVIIIVVQDIKYIYPLLIFLNLDRQTWRICRFRFRLAFVLSNTLQYLKSVV